MCLVVLMFYGIWRWESAREIVVTMSMEPETLIADGRSFATLRFLVTDPDGTPRAEDVMTLVRTKGHGQLKANRIKTDENGVAEVDYYSYRDGPFTPVMTNEIMVTHISAGKIVGVKKQFHFEIPLSLPEETEDGNDGKNEGNSGGHIQLGGGGG